MNILKTTIFLLFFSGFIGAQNHIPIWIELEGDELLDSLVENYKPTVVLEYGDARDTMYATIYNENDSVTCVYSGHTLFLPQGVDPSVSLYSNGSLDGINCEHTYPRSMGAAEENGNAYSDMHHLFPTRTKVNSGRSNFQYGEIPDSMATEWYHLNQCIDSIPTTNIDLYSERIFGMFEPRDDHKGNAARAVFYFFTMYKDEALAANSDFFENQRETLCDWHALDSVDLKEWNRTYQIAQHQDGLPNPFVLDCSLAYRTYCEGFDASSCYIPTTVDTTVMDTTATTTDTTTVDTSTTALIENIDLGINIYPNPVVDILHIEARGTLGLQVTDYVGRVLITDELTNFTTLDFGGFPKGIYFVKIKSKVYKIIKQI